MLGLELPSCGQRWAAFQRSTPPGVCGECGSGLSLWSSWDKELLSIREPSGEMDSALYASPRIEAAHWAS